MFNRLFDWFEANAESGDLFKYVAGIVGVILLLGLISYLNYGA